MAEASATGQYGPGRVAADIIGRADLKLGERVKPVLEALQAASPNRFRGLRHSVGWNPHSEVEDREIHEKCEADPIIGSTCPSPETNGIWIKKEFKPNYRPLGSVKEITCRRSQKVSAMGKLRNEEKENLSIPEARI